MDLQVHNRWHGWEWLFFFFFLLLCNGFHIHLSGSQINFSFVLSSHISIHMFHINPHRSLHQAPLRLLSTAEQFVLPANLALQICLNENLKQLCVATFWNVFFFFFEKWTSLTESFGGVLYASLVPGWRGGPIHFFSSLLVLGLKRSHTLQSFCPASFGSGSVRRI